MDFMDLEIMIRMIPFTWSSMSSDLEKTNSMNSAEFNFFVRFSAKLEDFSAKFGFLDVQVRNNFQNVIFIACKWCKICKYYVNSMVISCSACQKEEKDCILVNILFTQTCRNFNYVVIYALFSAKFLFPDFRAHKNIIYSKSAPRQQHLEIWTDKGGIVAKKYFYY